MSRNILFLVSSMGSGGAERVAATLVNAWADRGDSVTLVITFSGHGDCFYKLSPKVKLVYLSEYVDIAGRGLRAYWLRFLALRRLIRQKNPDVIVSFLTNVNIAGLVCSFGLCEQVIVSERSFPPKLPLGRVLSMMRRATYPFAEHVVMLSSEGLAWLNRTIPKARGVVIPNPVSFPLPNAKPIVSPSAHISPHRKLLLAVGRLDEGKQFDHVIEAFAALGERHLDWDLVIVGEGPERGVLERAIQRLEMSQRAFLIGRVGNIGDWYTRADLYVMSSRYEGFPNTLAEAMMYGCAAVCYDCETGPRDIVRDGLDGLLINPVGDVPALTQSLARLMGDSMLRQQMANRAIEVRERFSTQCILSKWDALFHAPKKHEGNG